MRVCASLYVGRQSSASVLAENLVPEIAPELTVGLTYDPEMTRDCNCVTERYGDIYVVVTPAVGSWFASLAAV